MGFLCIINGINFFDVFVVYFEVYFVVDKIIDIMVVVVNDIIGNIELFKSLLFDIFISEVFGLFIV